MKRKYLKEGDSGLNKPIERPPKMNEEEFTNYEYIKEFSKDSKATVRIENYERGKRYYYSTHTDKNKILAKYNVITIDEKTCELRYSETITSDNFLQKINDTLVGIVWGFLKKRKFKEMLQQIEASYTYQ